ncbi:MAG: GAF domain-containing protein [Verrucomicrobiota bacterium]
MKTLRAFKKNISFDVGLFSKNSQYALAWMAQHALKEASASYSAILLFNPNTDALDVEASHGVGRPHFLLRQAEYIARRGEVIRISEGSLLTASYFSSELIVPLEHKGQVIGLLYLAHKRPHAFSECDQHKIIAWTHSAVEWLMVVWEIHQLRFKSHQLEAIVNMGRAIVSQDSLPYVLNEAVKEACGLMRAKMGSIMLLSDDGAWLEWAASHGASKAYLQKPRRSVTDSLIGVVARRQKPIAVLNVQKDARYHYSQLAKKEGLVSLLSVPLVFKEQTLGVLSVYTANLHRFSNEEVRLMNAMAGLSAVAITKIQLMEKTSRLEEALKHAERLSALGWLAAEVAHEIRNPLAVVQMLFHSLLRSLKLDKTAARDAALIRSKMQQMNRILERILTFAKSSEPVMEPVDVASMLDDIVLLVRHKLAEQNIRPKVQVRSHLPPILGDRHQLEQALLNLVLNACQAMPNGGEIALSVKKSSQNSQLLIAVQDSGEGISAQRQKTLFQPLMSYRSGGVGLGLALVKKTIEQHQGRIMCRSRVGKGTTFQIFLPYAACGVF